MAAFVLDASIAVSWCFPGDPSEDTHYSRHILALLATHDAIVPQIWGFEIANCIFVSFNKRKRITVKQIDEYLRRLKGLPITAEPRDLWSTVDLEAQARNWNLTPYDAAYLDLALRRGLPLATNDDALKKAAIAEGIEVLSESSMTIRNRI
jgi:predicted nucleic acid-binding protein